MSEQTESEAATELVMSGHVCLATIESMLDDVRTAADQPDLVIDASGVEQMSTPATLMVLSLIATRADKTPPLAVKAPSSTFVDAFTELGFFQELMKMEFRQ